MRLAIYQKQENEWFMPNVGTHIIHGKLGQLSIQLSKYLTITKYVILGILTCVYLLYTVDL